MTAAMPPTKELRILLFEDSAMDAALIRKFLRTAGIQNSNIFHADTIPAALHLMGGEHIDLCLADYHLLPYTGVDLMEEARRSDIDVPFIVVTAIDDRGVDEEVLAHGAYDFLVKGDLTVEGLERSVRYAVANHRRKRALTRAAYFDSLTELPNRLAFLEKLAQTVSDVRTTGGLVGVALLNLNGTKILNTRHGHEIGDAVLIEAASRVRHLISRTQVIARIGGDEFALLLRNVLLPSHVLNAAKLFTDAITGPMEIGSSTHSITGTCGVAIHETKNADDPIAVTQKLMLNATHAMFDAKAAGRRQNTSAVALARIH